LQSDSCGEIPAKGREREREKLKKKGWVGGAEISLLLPSFLKNFNL
jgi:hypothetical protein